MVELLQPRVCRGNTALTSVWIEIKLAGVEWRISKYCDDVYENEEHRRSICFS